MEQKLKDLEENFAKEFESLYYLNLKFREKGRKELESLNAKLTAEKQELTLRLEREKETTAESDERSAKILAQKADVERQVRILFNVTIRVPDFVQNCPCAFFTKFGTLVTIIF